MDVEEDRLIVYAKKSRKENKYRNFSIRVPEQTMQRLNTLSTQSNCSRNELIGKLLKYALRYCEVREIEEDNGA